MKYQLTDYQGNQLTVTDQQAQKIADVAELIEVTVNGQTHYINKSNIASITPSKEREYNEKQIAAPERPRAKRSTVERVKKELERRGTYKSKIS